MTPKENINILSSGGLDFLNSGKTQEELEAENKEKDRRQAIARSKRQQNKRR
jgi:hypothetical protein